MADDWGWDGITHSPTSTEKPMTNTLDRNKPVTTRDGRKVVIYTWDAPGDWPVHGRVEGETGPRCWKTNGIGFGDYNDHLINAPETVERWWVVPDAQYLSMSIEDAKRHFTHGRSFMKVTYTDGNPTSVELVQP